MNLILKLAEVGSSYPEHEAIIYGNQRFTYNQLITQVNKLANALQKLGVQEGDRVLIALGNCPEFVISYYAVLQVKGVLVPVNPQYTINELGTIIKDALPKAVITSNNALPTFIKLKEKYNIPLVIVIRTKPVGSTFYSFEELVQKENSNFIFKSYARDDVIVLLYTHGSTGTLKGAMLTNNNLYTNAITFAQLCRLSHQDRSLLVAPAYHSAAQTCVMNTSLVVGATLVIHDRWKGPEAALRSIQDEQITFFYGPPTMYTLMVNYPELNNFDTSSLRVACSGAAPLPPEVFHNFHKKFGFEIIEGYGLTETSPAVCLNPVDGPKKVGSVGLPIPGVEIKIVDYEDRELPPGQVGEIIVRGPNVMKGYYNREEETKWVMRNGWFHTEDLAYMDSDGYIFIIDRKKDLIIRGGLNVHPREVEDVLYTHPRVFDVAVVGIPDPVWGEEIMAIVVLRGGGKIDPKELQDYCQDKLAKYKIPRYIRIVEDIPKTSSGKLLKYELKQLIENA